MYMYSHVRDNSLPRWIVLDCREQIIQIEKIVYNEELPTVDLDALFSRSFDCLRNRHEFDNETMSLRSEILHGDFLFSKIDYKFVSNPNNELVNVFAVVFNLLTHVKTNLERNRYYINDYFNYEYRSRDQNGFVYFECI